MYCIDTTYCYSPRSSVVCLYVCVCVCLLVTFVSHAKTDEPIEIPFGGWFAWAQRTMC